MSNRDEIESLLSDMTEAVQDLQDANSRVASIRQELEDLGVDSATLDEIEGNS